MNNIDDVNQRIRRNTFQGLNIGNEAGGDCGTDEGGLFYECNTNIGNTEMDFLVCNTSFGPDRIRKTQGRIIPDVNVVLATNNIFSNSGIGPFRDFNNEDQALEIDYHYLMSAGVLQTPTNGEFIGINPIASDINLCLQEYCIVPCLNETEISSMKRDFYLQKSLLNGALIAAENAFIQSDSALGEVKLGNAR